MPFEKFVGVETINGGAAKRSPNRFEWSASRNLRSLERDLWLCRWTLRWNVSFNSSHTKSGRAIFHHAYGGKRGRPEYRWTRLDLGQRSAGDSLCRSSVWFLAV